MKKALLFFLIIVLGSALIFGSCAKPTPATAPVPAPVPTPKPVEPIKLKWAHGVPPVTTFQTGAFTPWAEIIKERTTAIGKPVEIAFFPAESLVKMYDTYDALITGVCDIGSMWGPCHFKGRMPMGEVMELPFLFPSATVNSLVSQDIFKKWPEFQNDYREAKVLGFNPPAPHQIVSRTKPIKVLEDLKGMKTMCTGGIDVDILKALGAIPVPMPMPEVFMALERGTLDVGFLNWEGVVAFKWFEATKYRTELPKGLYSNSLIISMNWDTWNRLPPGVQEIFTELSGVYLSKLCGQAMDKPLDHVVGIIKQYDEKMGNPGIYYMPEDEYQRWVAAVTPLYEKWKADVEAKGLPGRAIFEDIQRLAEKYAKEYPK